MQRIERICGLLLLCLLLTACTQYGGQVVEVSIEVNASSYFPAVTEVEAGKTTKLTLKNSDTVEHQLAITEIPLVTQGGGTAEHNMAGMDGTMAPEIEPLQVHLVAGPGVTTSLELTPSKAGEYLFRCVIPGHTEQGTLIVK